MYDLKYDPLVAPLYMFRGLAIGLIIAPLEGHWGMGNWNKEGTSGRPARWIEIASQKLNLLPFVTCMHAAKKSRMTITEA